MSNRLLWGTVLVFLVYVGVGLVVPAGYFSVAVSVGLLLGAMLSLRSYGPTAFDVLFHGERDEDGGYLAVYGMALLALGAVVSGGYSVVWNLEGQPLEWIGTWYARLGSFIIMCGFFVLSYAPVARVRELKRPSLLWIAAVLLVAFAMGVIAGGERTQAGECPYAVSTRGIYHGVDSPYRALVVERECYDTEVAARLSGARGL